MGKVTAKGAAISDRALNRATLARQMLLERHNGTVLEVLRHLVGLQGQAGNAPYFGLWSRLKSFAIEDLQALLTERKAVRASLVRATLHVVTVEDFLAIRPMIQPQMLRTLTGGRKPEFEGLDIEAVQRAGRALMQHGPLAGTEIGKRLQGQFPAYGAEPLGRVVRFLEPLVHVPPAGFWNSGKAPVLAEADGWLSKNATPPMAVEDLVRRYLAAFGPASKADFTAWSGIGAAKAFEALRSELVTFKAEDGRELFDLATSPRPDESTPASVRLLAPWDNVILGYLNRDRMIQPDWLRHIATNNGLFRPTFTVDGFVRGIWALDEGKDSAVVTLSTFAPLTAKDKAALTREAEALLATLSAGKSVAVAFQNHG